MLAYAAYVGVVAAAWLFLVAAPLLALRLLELSHTQWLASLEEFATAATGQFDLVASAHAAHFVATGLFCAISLCVALVGW